MWNAVGEKKILSPIKQHRNIKRLIGVPVQNQENTERARAGVTGHNVRYVLIFGLLAVIIAFAIVYLVCFH